MLEDTRRAGENPAITFRSIRPHGVAPEPGRGVRKNLGVRIVSAGIYLGGCNGLLSHPAASLIGSTATRRSWADPYFEQSNFRVSNSLDGPGCTPAKAIRIPHLGQRRRYSASMIEGGGLGMAAAIPADDGIYLRGRNRRAMGKPLPADIGLFSLCTLLYISPERFQRRRVEFEVATAQITEGRR